MAGEKPQETGHHREYAHVSLERRKKACPGSENREDKRQPELTLSGGLGKRISVHHDGLVHVSELAERFVSDPHAVVKVGHVVKVKIIKLDLEQKRIGLSMRIWHVS